MSGAGDFSQTEKQMEIIDIVMRAADAGEVMTYQRLQARLSYGRSICIQSVHCSVKFLEKHGVLVRVKSPEDSRKTLIKPTTLAYEMFRPTPAVLK